jgi:ParB/RepB/Spo0J family partition protein
MLTHDIELIPPQNIFIPRDERQRREVDVDDLIPSIQRLGILNPIIVDQDGTLVAGERRLTAAIKLGLEFVPIRRTESLSEIDAQLVELDENLRREELPWQDRALAMKKMLDLFRQEDPGQTVQSFSDFIGYHMNHVHKCLAAADELARGNERVLRAPTMTKAINVLTRENERVTNNALADIIDSFSEPAEAPPLESDDVLDSTIFAVETIASDQEERDIQTTSFHEWADNYRGEKFNLIHCDFPYGLDFQDSDQAGSDTRRMYEDSEDVYWELLQTLAANQDRIVSSSAHMIFWYSMKYHTQTLEFLSHYLPEWTFDELPLIWHKTDNKGIAPDVERRPRRVYETALFGWRGDRKLVKLGSNAYGAPKANSSHVSEKPEPVLRQFLSMVCDSHTRLLDPTCGSGSALRAAESLGASKVLGLEIDPEHAADARAKLKTFRALRRLSK